MLKISLNLLTSGTNNSRGLRIKTARFSGYCFHMNPYIQGDFQICIMYLYLLKRKCRLSSVLKLGSTYVSMSWTCRGKINNKTFSSNYKYVPHLIRIFHGNVIYPTFSENMHYSKNVLVIANLIYYYVLFAYLKSCFSIR